MTREDITQQIRVLHDIRGPAPNAASKPKAGIDRMVVRAVSARISQGLHTLTRLTCQKPRNPQQQALSKKQVQITYATELANSEVSVYTLMKLLGHESMATSQRYVAGAARETRTAAAQNRSSRCRVSFG